MSTMPLLPFVLLMAGALALSGARPPSCGDCDEGACRPPTDCLSGLVRDSCGCCYVCGRREGQLCDGPGARQHGPCGEGLECRPRTDLTPADPPEHQCACLKTEAHCGSDGLTYENECALTEARYRARNGLQALHRGPCRNPPKIVSPPEEVSNVTGGNVAMSCEATGWPIPAIEWRVDRGDGDTVPLPSDDPKVAVQSRGGPSKYEVTGWLQLLSIQPLDDATYWCIAKNDEGESSAAARVIVLDSTINRISEEDRGNDL